MNQPSDGRIERGGNRYNRVLEYLLEETDPESLDVAGVLAYGLYEIRKRDWIVSFQQETGGRRPDDRETAAVTQNYLTPSMRQTLRGQASDVLTA